MPFGCRFGAPFSARREPIVGTAQRPALTGVNRGRRWSAGAAPSFGTLFGAQSIGQGIGRGMLSGSALAASGVVGRALSTPRNPGVAAAACAGSMGSPRRGITSRAPSGRPSTPAVDFDQHRGVAEPGGPQAARRDQAWRGSSAGSGPSGLRRAPPHRKSLGLGRSALASRRPAAIGCKLRKPASAHSGEDRMRSRRTLGSAAE